MIATFRAEAMKLVANRTTLVWGFLAAPLIVLFFGIAGDAFVAATTPQARAVGRAPLLADATAALGAAGNPIWHLFFIMGAGVIFAGEYRWETWRYLVPRARRADLMLGKMAAFAAFAAGSVMLMALAGLLAAIVSAFLNQAAPAALADPARAWAAFAMMAGIGVLHLCALAALTALVSVLTRSLLAALLAVFLFGFAQAVFAGVFGEAASDPRFIAAMPNLAAGTVRGLAAHVAGDPDATGQYGALALGLLVCWIVVPLGAAVAVFQRQDLSQE
jgi:ABC-2 type transport system permease protein